MDKFSLFLISSISVIFSLNNSICQADTFVVPLQVSGTYSMGQNQPFSFDLGTALSEVHSVTFACDGLITAGVDYDGTPFSCGLLAYLNADADSLMANGGAGGPSFYPAPEPFSVQNQFVSFSKPPFGNLDFLFDGKASGSVVVLQILNLLGYEPLVLPQVTINNASIIIDAEPVPEPATLLFLSFGLILLRKKK